MRSFIHSISIYWLSRVLEMQQLTKQQNPRHLQGGALEGTQWINASKWGLGSASGETLEGRGAKESIPGAERAAWVGRLPAQGQGLRWDRLGTVGRTTPTSDSCWEIQGERREGGIAHWLMADSRCLSSGPQVCMPATVCACVCVCTSVHVCVRVWQRPYTARQSGCCWVLPGDTGLSYLFVRNEYQQELERPSVCDPQGPLQSHTAITLPSPSPSAQTPHRHHPGPHGPSPGPHHKRLAWVPRITDVETPDGESYMFTKVIWGPPSLESLCVFRHSK